MTAHKMFLGWVTGWVLLALSASAVRAASAESPRARAAIFVDGPSGPGVVWARQFSNAVTAAGYDGFVFDQTVLASGEFLRSNGFDLVVLGNARVMPAKAAGSVETYLRGGGDLLACGLPVWADARFDVGGRWLSRSEYDRVIASQSPSAVLENFERANGLEWKRQTNDRRSGVRAEIVPDGGSLAMRVVIENLTGWETLAGPSCAQAVPENHRLTCFRARGSVRTRQLAVEWAERDGSRWIATVELGEEWRSYALPPEAFQPWNPPPGRGGAGDHLEVSRAVRCTIGLAHTHTGSQGGRQEYAFDDLGTAPNPFGAATRPEAGEPPRLETLAPGYLFHPVHGPAALSTDGGVGARGIEAMPGIELLAIHPRPRGVGYAQGRPWRWEPLLVARAPEVAGAMAHRGAVATLLIHDAAPFRGGVWAAFTPAAADFYGQPAVEAVVRDALKRMRRGLFLIEGGADQFTVFDDQAVRVGARVANFGRGLRPDVRVTVRVRDKSAGATVLEKAWILDLGAGESRGVDVTWRPDRWPPGGGAFEVTAELWMDGKVVDRLQHELRVWRPSAEPRYVEARDGGLFVEGRPWKAHGVNYMPSSGIGVADHSYFEHWLGRGAYDPEVIERDLERIRDLGMNAVSVFVYHQSRNGHLLDFLGRCRALGFWVNQSLRPGTPMEFRWEEMRELIETFRLATNETVMAYDLAWEPSHYDHAYQQRQYARLWASWVNQRHGSVSAAAAAWGVPAPGVTAGEGGGRTISVPPMAQLTQDGPWRALVADYRRFLDELVGARYAEARRLVRSIDPHHAVSFRMQMAGDPTHNAEGLLPYDFRGLSGAVDIWEPEAYGRIGDWRRVRGGHFTAAYARLCRPDLPVVWAEMGYSVWNNRTMAPAPDRQRFAAQYYTDFYRMMRESGADGVFFWWYPGGYRLNERSDYGVIEPDGTDRPLSGVIRREGRRFLAEPKPPVPTRWLEVDRDLDARGLAGIYEAVQDEYWPAVEAGEPAGLRWARRQ